MTHTNGQSQSTNGRRAARRAAALSYAAWLRVQAGQCEPSAFNGRRARFVTRAHEVLSTMRLTMA